MNAANKMEQGVQGLRYFDAPGDLDAAKIADIRATFEETGAVHITNTNITDKAHMLALMPQFGFGEDEQFAAGGRTSSAWQTKWVAPGLRNLDYYPPHLHLLANNEVSYQRHYPTRILFFCTTPSPQGGRTFLHASRNVEALLSQSETGRTLIKNLSAHGMNIEVGFLDEQHPEKKNNYYQSWQERFGTKSKDEALQKAQSLHNEYDECWWQEHDGHSVLMTRITMPAYVTSKQDGETYLRFARVAMDAGSIRNGFRKFPLGNGVELSEEEKALLKDVYTRTGEGFGWKTGDIILMDNTRYAHSREPFTGAREVLIGMAGQEYIEKNHKE